MGEGREEGRKEGRRESENESEEEGTSPRAIIAVGKSQKQSA